MSSAQMTETSLPTRRKANIPEKYKFESDSEDDGELHELDRAELQRRAERLKALFDVRSMVAPPAETVEVAAPGGWPADDVAQDVDAEEWICDNPGVELEIKEDSENKYQDAVKYKVKEEPEHEIDVKIKPEPESDDDDDWVNLPTPASSIVSKDEDDGDSFFYENKFEEDSNIFDMLTFRRELPQRLSTDTQRPLIGPLVDCCPRRDPMGKRVEIVVMTFRTTFSFWGLLRALVGLGRRKERRTVY